MAVRPSPRAPHSSTCPKLSAALSWSGRPVSGLAPASKPLAWASTGSFGGLTVHRTNDPTGSRTAKTGVAGSRRWGRRRRERRPGPPPSSTHDGRGDGTGGPGRHLCTGHAPTGSRPLARMPSRWAGPAGGRARTLSRLLSFSTRGLQQSHQLSFRSTAPGSCYVSDLSYP